MTPSGAACSNLDLVCAHPVIISASPSHHCPTSLPTSSAPLSKPPVRFQPAQCIQHKVMAARQLNPTTYLQNDREVPETYAYVAVPNDESRTLECTIVQTASCRQTSGKSRRNTSNGSVICVNLNEEERLHLYRIIIDAKLWTLPRNQRDNKIRKIIKQFQQNMDAPVRPHNRTGLTLNTSNCSQGRVALCCREAKEVR